jgi:environmental stress-induced protein Ves
MDRHSVVIEGDACQLRSGETLVELRPFTVVQYPGGLAWTCTLGGHMATVFNVMCESGRWRAIIHIARDRLELDGCAGELILFPVNCSILVMTPVDGVTVIPQGHVAVCTQAHGVVYPVDRTESGFVLIVRLLACAS